MDMNQSVVTKSIILQTLSVPCGCRCRYCLLSWDGHPIGADYERSKQYAHDFYRYIHEKRPEIQFHFTFGYSMEHPHLLEELDFLNSIGSVQGQFLQLGGMDLHTSQESAQFIEGVPQISLFIPHAEGRGKNLDQIRFSEGDLQKL